MSVLKCRTGIKFIGELIFGVKKTSLQAAVYMVAWQSPHFELREMNTEFAKLMRSGVAQDGDPMCTGLDLLRVDRRGYGAWLHEFMADEESMNFAASYSYLHVNGFAKIVLASFDKPAYRLRLHIWNDQGD